MFDAAPGPAIVVGIVDLGDRFRLVANGVDVVPPDEPLPSLPVARAVWQPAPDLRTAAEAWLTAGGPHHTVLDTARRASRLLRGLRRDGRPSSLLIDSDTRTPAFKRELRWNQAYYFWIDRGACEYPVVRRSWSVIVVLPVPAPRPRVLSPLSSTAP